ncbi:TonB-dependent receptor plug domain-containing protein, partial [Asaia sp. SF2.1]|uniref:TonB-dependent receptor plug domain-containing protein n=1 Tax=Asaia sp. SF2.1 TaxID=406101 RepID=UPI001F3C2D80
MAGLSTSAAMAATVPMDATATKKKTLVKTKQATSKSETIMVTGSYLRSSNNSSANPVQIVTAKQIQQTSAVSLGDYLQRLPSVGSSGTPNQQTNGGG